MLHLDRALRTRLAVNVGIPANEASAFQRPPCASAGGDLTSWLRLGFPRALALVAIALAGIRGLFGQLPQPPAFNPAYGPTQNASRQKIVVTSTADTINGDVSGWSALIAQPGSDGISLREALTVANLTAGPKEIDFDPKLKGATILLFTATKQALPYFSAGDLILDGDIDHDGQPDVTLDGSASEASGPTSLCFYVWSSRNHINGLRLQNFLGPLKFAPTNLPTDSKTAADNRITNNWVDATRSGGTGIFMTIWGYGRTLNDFVWSNTIIAGNFILCPPNSNAPGIWLASGGDNSRNQFLGTTIIDNIISGTGITVYPADTNSTFDGDNNPPKPGVPAYSDENLVQDLLIQNNRISEARMKGIELACANFGNSRNRIINVLISGNTIIKSNSTSAAAGIFVQCARISAPNARACQDNAIENLTIEKNVISGNFSDGIFAGVLADQAGDPQGPGQQLYPGGSNNSIKNVIVRQNTISDYKTWGIDVRVGRSASAWIVQNNRLTGLQVSDNVLNTGNKAALAGILIAAGMTVNFDGKGGGVARQNLIESATTTGNRVRGGAASIEMLGGRGPLADDNHITGLTLAENDVEMPPIVITNEADATGNNVEVLPATNRLINLSTRGFIPVGGTLTPGFVMRGRGSKSLVIRAVGPTLAAYGVSSALADPKLDVFAQGTAAAIMANDDWGGSPSLRNASAGVGAFPLESGSKDSAVEASLAVNGSGYTVRIAPNGATSAGIVLAEIYDADSFAAPVRLVNVATLGFAGAGENVLTAGFVVGGTGTKNLLIRAVGPGLAQFGVTGWLADPQLQVLPTGQSTAVASNDNWSGTVALKSTFTTAGAFVLPDASKDAAVFARLPPGGYTVVISGAGATTGTALVEIYDLDP